MIPSSEREMPTVTVLAWCLIASIGPGEFLDRTGERGDEFVDQRAGRADLARRPRANDSTGF